MKRTELLRILTGEEQPKFVSEREYLIIDKCLELINKEQDSVNKLTERQEDVKKLSSAVLDMSPEYWDNPNGAYESKCPLCGAVVYGGGEKPWADMSEITHETTCAYLIAKDLHTNL